MKKSKLNPGKRCPQCSDGSCGSCIRGFIIKRKTPAKRPHTIKVGSQRDLARQAQRTYSKRRKVFLMIHQRCLTLGLNGPCNQPTTDIHHRLGRGQFLLNEETWWPCCSKCHHERIHGNPKWAHTMGYLLNRASGIIRPVSTAFLPYNTNDRSPS